MRNVEVVLFLVVLGTVVAAFAGRLRIPAPSLLVIAGLAVGLLPWAPAVRVPPDAVSLVVLPPLLYAASEELAWRDLRAVLRPVAVLAVGLVLASAAAVAAVAGAVVSWAGTRGVVPLAAALSIPLTTAGGGALPQQNLVLVLAAATIVVSLIVQGFILEPLARLAGFRPTAAAPGHEETMARLRMAEAGLARLEELADGGAAPDEVIDRLRASLQARIRTTRAGVNLSPDAAETALTERELRGDLITAENAELSRLYDAGTIGAATRRRLQRNLDLEAARLTEGQR